MDTILKDEPDVPVAKVWTELVSPLIEVTALPDNKFENRRVVTLPSASVVKTFVFATFVPIPAKRTPPVVCNCAVGEEIPIPTLPEFLL